MLLCRVTYTSGKETDREELSRKTLVKPTDQIIHVGVIETIDGFAYTRKETFQATAYTGGGRTASGTRARVGEIAVDPRVIPLGTTVYVEGFGERRAEDTGGAIKGHIIDIYMSSKGECRRWGRRNVTVYLP
ncbi:MAG: G5 domain-containing protein [Firmicutes bacterium]|nr:G5 domain-containing protein [Bacillota bacterium]